MIGFNKIYIEYGLLQLFIINKTIKLKINKDFNFLNFVLNIM